jgi:hypothetical protein
MLERVDGTNRDRSYGWMLIAILTFSPHIRVFWMSNVSVKHGHALSAGRFHRTMVSGER